MEVIEEDDIMPPSLISAFDQSVAGLSSSSQLTSSDSGSPSSTSSVPQEGWPECNSIVVLRALNEAYQELVDQMICKVERALEINRIKQENVVQKQAAFRESELLVRKKVAVHQYLPPYFKDDGMMCPPLSDEAKLKLENVMFDPLSKEEKKWVAADLKKLRSSVKNCLIQQKIQSMLDRKMIIVEKIQNSGQETDEAQIAIWKDEIEVLNRKINFERNQPEADILFADYTNVDWVKIANIDFDGHRTPDAVRLKWMNEQCPRWNNDPWTKEELKHLKTMREKNFTSWSLLAEQLGTRRTPWMCFEKYYSEVALSAREWTPEEDEKLIALVNIMTVNGKIQWNKVTYNMRGRTRQQIRARYLRTLDKNIKHGRWTDPEDLLLMCAVSRYGAKDWYKIARNVPGRTDVQCRDRWISGLDKRNSSREWSLEDDEKLLILVSIFGRGRWVECSDVLADRLPDQCRYRFQTLLAMKIKLCCSQLQNGTINPYAQPGFHTRQSLKNMELNRKYRKFNTMVNGNDESGDQLLKSIMEKTTKPKKRLKKTDEATMNELYEKAKEAADEISERYKNGVLPEIEDVIKDIPLSEEDIFSIMKQSKVNINSSKNTSRYTQGDKVRKIRKTQYLTADVVPIKVNFERGTPEESRVSHMNKALREAVRKYDQHQWNYDFARDHTTRSYRIAQEFVATTIQEHMETGVEYLKKGEAIPKELALPANNGNMSAYVIAERARPKLTQMAGELFHRADISIFDEQHTQVGSCTDTYTVRDRLNIQLSSEITESDEYMKLMASMRSILMVPASMQIACEPSSSTQYRSYIRDHLMIRKEEEHRINDGTVLMMPNTNNTLNDIAVADIPFEAEELVEDVDPSNTRSAEADTSVDNDEIQEPPFKKPKRASRNSKPTVDLNMTTTSEESLSEDDSDFI